MSKSPRPIRPVKALQIHPDGTVHDPNTCRIFSSAKEAADWWGQSNKLYAIIAAAAKEKEPEIFRKPEDGDVTHDRDGLWGITCHPEKFSTENAAQAFSRWTKVGGDRTIVKGKSFPATLDDLLRLACYCTPDEDADQTRADAANAVGRSLSMFRGALPWINPRLDVSLVVSSEFVQATILTGTPEIPGFRIRATMTGHLELFSDDSEFDLLQGYGGHVQSGNTADELGAISTAVAHIQQAVDQHKHLFPQWIVCKDEIVLPMFAGNPYPCHIQVPYGANIVSNPRKTSFSLLSSSRVPIWNYLETTEQARTLWTQHISEGNIELLDK